MDKIRCGWSEGSEIYKDYHDREWGVPQHDDTVLFEFIVLEGAQAGLSWITILKRREGYRKAFAAFDYEKVAQFSEAKQEELRQNPEIIRNRLKIKSAVNNAQQFIKIRKEWGTFSKYLWHFTDGKVVQNSWKTLSEVPVNTPLSDTISKDLKKRGFTFVGSTIIYSLLQAVGVVNDHILSCYRHKELL